LVETNPKTVRFPVFVCDAGGAIGAVRVRRAPLQTAVAAFELVEAPQSGTTAMIVFGARATDSVPIRLRAELFAIVARARPESERYREQARARKDPQGHDPARLRLAAFRSKHGARRAVAMVGASVYRAPRLRAHRDGRSAEQRSPENGNRPGLEHGVLAARTRRLLRSEEQLAALERARRYHGGCLAEVADDADATPLDDQGPRLLVGA